MVVGIRLLGQFGKENGRGEMTGDWDDLGWLYAKSEILTNLTLFVVS